MALNLLLLAFSSAFTGIVPQDAPKPSRLHRVYDFIVRSQTRRAEHEVARYLQRTSQALRR